MGLQLSPLVPKEAVAAEIPAARAQLFGMLIDVRQSLEPQQFVSSSRSEPFAVDLRLQAEVFAWAPRGVNSRWRVLTE